MLDELEAGEHQLVVQVAPATRTSMSEAFGLNPGWGRLLGGKIMDWFRHFHFPRVVLHGTDGCSSEGARVSMTCDRSSI